MWSALHTIDIQMIAFKIMHSSTSNTDYTSSIEIEYQNCYLRLKTYSIILKVDWKCNNQSYCSFNLFADSSIIFYLGILPHNSMKLISIHFYAWMKFFRDRAIIFKYYLYQKSFVLLRYMHLHTLLIHMAILVWLKIILAIPPIYYDIKKI